MTQPLASGVTACHQLKTDRMEMPALSPFSEPLPLLTGDTLHVAGWSQIKEGIVGTGMEGALSGDQAGWHCGQEPFADKVGTQREQV